jgi:formate--tetrahydrofolate ligase
VLVATVRALKMHGVENLAAHVEIVRAFGVPCVVALNASREDVDGELEAALAVARGAGARAAVVARPSDEGGAGCVELACAMTEACRTPSSQRLLYPDELGLEEKLEVIAKRVYGASGIELSGTARERFEELDRKGHGRLPICIAKTQLSLSHAPKLVGRPCGFQLPVRDVRLAAGAGFVVAITGDMALMPGLPSKPAGEDVDVDNTGAVVGLR